MPSRRRFLTAAGLFATTGVSGCLTATGISNIGFLSYKGIEVTWEFQGQRMGADLCWVWSDGQERIFGWVAEEYQELVRSPTDIRVTRSTAERLRRDFSDVRFKLGFSRLDATDYELLKSDWYHAHASRDDFNHIQFGDQAEIVFRSPRVYVINQYPSAQGNPDDWEQELGTMNFSELYKDRGVPI